MKVFFYIGPRERNIAQPEPIEISYEHKGRICSVIVYGDINKPQVLIVPSKALQVTPISRYWFFMNISWSKLDGFEFNQYSDPEINTSLSSSVGTLRGTDKIQINKGFLALTFKAEVNQADLVDNEPKTFLEVSSKFGIKVVDIDFSECRSLHKLNCSDCQLANVRFINSELKDADFKGAKFNNVSFKNSNLESANFSGSTLDQVEFSESNLKKSVFDNCSLTSHYYSKSKIDKDEVIIFKACDLTDSSFIKAKLCSKFEDSNLFRVNFLDAKLVACKFQECKIIETQFTKSQFISIRTQNQSSQSQKPNQINEELIICSMGPNPDFLEKGIIEKCKFNGASMEFVNFSNNIIKNTDFESAYLRKAKFHNCDFWETTFNSKTTGSANLSDTNFSSSKFKNCNFNEVNLTRVRMIEATIEYSNFIRANFYSANLRSSSFTESDLTGANFRLADLTMLSFDRCHLNCANFLQTRRGGLKLNRITASKNIDKNEIDSKNTCTIDCIDWSLKGDGEIQIDGDSFLKIVAGEKSAAAVISSLSKEAAQFISNIYASATAKSAGEDFNDASANVVGDAENSEIMGGSNETDNYIENQQEEDENQESSNSFSDEASVEDNE